MQDRLREWNPDVMRKIEVYSCLAIEALDIDAIRVDKATQVTVDALANWATSTRACAVKLGKKNFFITGEVTGGDTFGSLYIGRGRTPALRPTDFQAAATITSNQNALFLRDAPRNSLDSVAFHYSIYRSLTRFLGMDGNLQAAYDVNENFVTAWNELFVDNDMLNSLTGRVDPRHMYGISNFDVFRWPSLANGTQRQQLGTFINTLLMPGIPLVRYNMSAHKHSTNHCLARSTMVKSRLSTSSTMELPIIFMGRLFSSCNKAHHSLLPPVVNPCLVILLG